MKQFKSINKQRGFLSLLSKLFGGDKAAGASKTAARIQSKSAARAAKLQRRTTKDIIKASKESEERARGDVAPFREAGISQLTGPQNVFKEIDKTTGAIDTAEGDIAGVRKLITDPNEQKSYVLDNPFFKALANEAQQRLFSNQAAKGKLGSGGTAEALQNSILLLGSDLLNQNIGQRQALITQGFNLAGQRAGVAGQRFNIAAMGANAAANQATLTQNASAQNAGVAQSGAANITDLITGGANARAAGVVGASNAQQAAMETGINTILGIGKIVAISDKRLKKQIKKVGKDEKGLNVYTFKYKGDDKLRIGHMAQDVEKKYPDAVLTINNIKTIDYGVLNANRS